MGLLIFNDLTLFFFFSRIGFGFQGVMKRWGMKGGPRSHGSTKFHRKRGTIGSGRVKRTFLNFYYVTNEAISCYFN